MNRQTDEFSFSPAYRALLDRAVAVLSEDQRVLAVWLSGSWARGDGDPASDLDLVVTTTDHDYQSFLAETRQWWAIITPTVLLECLRQAPNIWYSLAPDGCRLDIVVEQESTLPATGHRHRIPLVDPRGLLAKLPPLPAASGPDAAGVGSRLKELFRILCLLKVLAIRQDWLLGVQGCALLQHILADLYAAANGGGPSGTKHYSSRLSAEQRATLMSLPPIAATREAVIAGHEAVLEAVTKTVPALAAGLGLEWPAALERTARQQVAEAAAIS